MRIRFASSAGRHGISEDRIRYVMARCEVALYPADDDEGEADRVLFVGPDRNGIPLEIVALELAEGDLLVIHAMKLRRKYRERYLQVMRWPDR